MRGFVTRFHRVSFRILKTACKMNVRRRFPQITLQREISITSNVLPLRRLYQKDFYSIVFNQISVKYPYAAPKRHGEAIFAKVKISIRWIQTPCEDSLVAGWLYVQLPNTKFSF